VSRQWLITILVVLGVFAFASQGLKGGPEVSVREAAALVKSAPPPVLIDVREVAAFENGRIAGARSVPAAEFKDRLAGLKLSKTEPIILYSSGDDGDAPAREATKHLYESGYQGALTLKGGITAWRAAGHPLATK
jgi:thiosulfate/3-mercaptopyruvate sulfurtransferase